MGVTSFCRIRNESCKADAGLRLISNSLRSFGAFLLPKTADDRSAAARIFTNPIFRAAVLFELSFPSHSSHSLPSSFRSPLKMARRILFFDTETTGLGPGADLVEICWMIYDGRQRGKVEHHLVAPDGWVIPAAATRIHGIAHDRAVREGRPLRQVLQSFFDDVQRCHVIVAHNLQFDRRIVHSVARARLDLDAGEFWRHPITEFCTYQNARMQDRRRGIQAAPSYKLGFLYHDAFGHELANAHSADADVDALQRLFWARWGEDEDNGRLATRAVRIAAPPRAPRAPRAARAARAPRDDRVEVDLANAVAAVRIDANEPDAAVMVLISEHPRNTTCFHSLHSGCVSVRPQQRTLLEAQATAGRGGEPLRGCRKCWPHGVPQ